VVPSYPDLPMEEVYPRIPRTNIPGVFLRETGGGRVAYFPWDLDRTFWEVLDVDHGKLLKNAVLWVSDEEPPVTVSGPGVIDVSIWRQKASITVHLVNLTNPMMMKGPVREIIPLPAQLVRLKIPTGDRVAGVRFLVGTVKPQYRISRDVMELHVPSIGLHEVIAVDLA